MNTMHLDLDFPDDKSLETRLSWAGDRFADLAEGTLEPQVGWFVWGMIVGWCDDASTNESRQYLEIARHFEEFLKQS